MASGATKRLTGFSTELIVQIFAWEGLLYDSQRRLGTYLKAILDGEDSPENWDGLDAWRKKSIFYSQQYTKSILSLQIQQNRG